MKAIAPALLILTTMVFRISLSAQKPFELGGEFIRASGQGYATNKVAVRYESYGNSFTNKNSYSIGITKALASGKSYSVSRGFGLYAGFRHAFGNNLKGNNPFAGLRLLFSLENFEGKTSRNSLLITPWAEAGYHLTFLKRVYAAPSVGYGYTFKFSKDYNSLDEDVGKRFIPSVSLGYRF